MAVSERNKRRLSGQTPNVNLFVADTVTDKPAHHIWSDPKGLAFIEPTKPLGLLFAACSRSTFQVYPERSTFNHLKIDVPSTHLRMVQNHVNSGITADHREWLM